VYTLTLVFASIYEIKLHLFQDRRPLAPLVVPPAPLAVSDDGGGGDQGGPPPGHDPDPDPPPFLPPAEEAPPELQPAPPSTTTLRRIMGYIKFAWAFLESLMTSGTNYLNKFSRDYRLVARLLAEEKRRLKV